MISHSQNPFPVWKVLRPLSGFIVDHLRWLIGSGQKMIIWFDSWLLPEPILFYPSFFDNSLVNVFKITSLISIGNWDLRKGSCFDH